jgi:hypothetical protein
MTKAQTDAIIERLDLMNTRLNAQSKKIDELKSEIDRMEGGLAVLKAIGGLLGVGGIGAVLSWLISQGK